MAYRKFKNIRLPHNSGELLPSGWSLILVLFSYIFMFAALILFIYGFSLLYQRLRPATFSELTQEIPVAPIDSSLRMPSALEIGSVHLLVPVIQGSIIDGEWQVAEDAVSIVSMGDDQQTGLIIYGHNYPRLLGSLQKVQQQDEIALVLKNGEKIRYRVTGTQIVKPDSIYSLTPGDFTDLIIYTCTGFLDSKRLIVKAELVG